MEKKTLLEIDQGDFTRMTSVVVDYFTEGLGTTEFDDRVKALGEKVPYLLKITGACVTALNRTQESGNGPIHEDTNALRLFLEHKDMFCFLQGAVTMLMTVTETLEKERSSKTNVSKSPSTRPSRKGKRRGS